MNKKILAAVCSMVLLCSCGKGDTEVLETGTESVSAAESVSETLVSWTALSTAAETFSEETESAAETSEVENKEPVTREFFNDDVVFEEVMMPVKVTKFDTDGTEYFSRSYVYDAAGNLIDEGGFLTYEYDYNPDGTYNSVFEYRNGKRRDKFFYDKNGYCLGYSPTENKYEFDGGGRLIHKENGSGYVEYSYDENGRLYEEYDNSFGSVSFKRYEYGDRFENVYLIDEDSGEKILYHIMEKDGNGNTIKETFDEGALNPEYISGKMFAEYKYDGMNRLVYEKHTTSDDFSIPNDAVYDYTRAYEYEGDNLKKETYSYDRYNESTEYFYDGNGRLVKKIYIFEGGANELTMQYPAEDTTEYFYNEDGTIISQTHNMDGVLTEETEYAMIPKIKTDIEYLNYYNIKP